MWALGPSGHCGGVAEWTMMTHIGWAPLSHVPRLHQFLEFPHAHKGLPLFMVLSFYPTMTWDWTTPILELKEVTARETGGLPEGPLPVPTGA